MLTLAALAALSVALAAPRAAAEESKREGLKEFVASLAASVQKATGDRPVRVGYFTLVGNDHSNAGGAFMAAVAQRLGAMVQADARLELKGEFQLIDGPKAPGLKLICVDTTLKDIERGGNFKEFTPFEGAIRAAADLAAILVFSVAFKPDNHYGESPDAGRNRDVQRRGPPGPGKPPAVTAAVAGFLVRASADSKYAVEIQAGPAVDWAFKTIAARLDEGAYPGLSAVGSGRGSITGCSSATATPSRSPSGCGSTASASGSPRRRATGRSRRRSSARVTPPPAAPTHSSPPRGRPA